MSCDDMCVKFVHVCCRGSPGARQSVEGQGKGLHEKDPPPVSPEAMSLGLGKVDLKGVPDGSRRSHSSGFHV